MDLLGQHTPKQQAQKDLADLMRLAESNPAVRTMLPAEIVAELE